MPGDLTRARPRRTLGRRLSDFLRPIITAMLLAIATNAGQFLWAQAQAAALSEYWARYVAGLH